MNESSLHVLIVDDSSEERLIMRRLLTRSASEVYTITEADRGTRALAACAATQPDCVLLDHSLPDMDGLEVFAALRAQNDVPIVVLTGVDITPLIGTPPWCGSLAFLSKRTLTVERLGLAIAHAVADVRFARAYVSDMALLRTMIDTISIGVGMFDQNLRIIQVNPALATLLGCPTVTLCGQQLADCWPELAQALAPACLHVLATGQFTPWCRVVAGLPNTGKATCLWQVRIEPLTLPDTAAPGLCLLMHAEPAGGAPV